MLQMSAAMSSPCRTWAAASIASPRRPRACPASRCSPRGDAIATAAGKRILFFAEPATLAHVMRPVALARALSGTYECALATGPDYRGFVEREALQVRELKAAGTRAFLHAVQTGRVVYSFPTLDGYVREDLRHIEAYAPDVVVGDFRLSLAVSARLAKVPYVALSNAYWSPCAGARYAIPVHRATKWLGPGVADAVFRLLRPLILAHHSLPMHRLRRRYGMRSLGFDLGTVFTEGDVTAYADVPELVPGADCGLPQRYRYIGPVLWSPQVALPDALAATDGGKPWIYVTMGSSGDPRLVPAILAALEALPCRVAVSTAGAVPTASIPDGVLAADYLPGEAVAARASLVICNGGSPGTYQALAQGTPVLGIAANLDQLLNMQFVARCGAGAMLRADEMSASRLSALASRVLGTETYSARARAIALACRQYHAPSRFATILRELAP